MVYVDDMYAPYGRMKMCHLVADTTVELNAMADAIGVARRWIQDAGTWREHYDVCTTKRQLAVKAGAKEIKYGSELAALLEKKRKASLR
jgi:hypothetical protein